MAETERRPSDFIRDMIAADVASGKHAGKVCTRFPPEPNGYLHIGHAKSICLNFGVAQEFGGECHLRMDDTNPTTEDTEYVASIQADIRWLGFSWKPEMFYASDYFSQLYDLAEKLIRLGRAYVCDLTEEQMSEYRGTVTQAGKESPFRSRTVEVNLDLFRRMRAGEFKEGQRVLRAKIDMASPNMKMRDPPLYRIKHAHHHRTGDAWCLYPLYDYAHCLSDSIEGITHSLCTMEFESARELYDWVVQATAVPWVPRQTEFARLNLNYTVMSKRRLLELVQEKHVSGWDDPRLPTISGMRRRGYTPEAIREFCGRIGVAKNLSVVDMSLLEHTLREDLDRRSPRFMGVLRPLRLVVESYPEGETEEFEAPCWPSEAQATAAGGPKTRRVPFCRELFIDRDDFSLDPPPDFHRLAPGKQVRLRHAYVVTCTGVSRDDQGEVTEVRCTHDPLTRGGSTPAGKKVDGTLHWVSARHAIDAQVKLYDRLFTSEIPGGEGGDWKADLNPRSLEVVTAKLEPALGSSKLGDRFQLERQGYFTVDLQSGPGALVLNRTVTLKDTWTRAATRPLQKPTPGPAKSARTEAPKPTVSALSPEAAAIKGTYGIGDDEARALESAPALRQLLDQAIAAKAPTRETATLVCNEVLGELRVRKLDRPGFSGAALAELMLLVSEGTLSSRMAKDVLSEMIGGGGSPRAIVAKKGLTQMSAGAELEGVVSRVLASNTELVARFKAGNANLIGALVGAAMKESGGRANPKALNELLRKRLT